MNGLSICSRHKEYRAQSSSGQTDEIQKAVTSFFGAAHSNRYSSSHSQQKAITAALIEDLIVKCNLPLSLVENEHFRHFLSVVDSRYTPPSRSTVASQLANMAEKVEQQIGDSLDSVKSVNLTLDIWSDRTMRSYLGITAHYVAPGKSELCSSLLSCGRFSGSHTGERIAVEVESTLDQYHIKQKVDHVITDNAANMRKAMTITFSNIEDNADDEATIDNEEIWQDVNDEDQQEIFETLNSHCRRERLSCFDHTLHLVVGDGLKDTKCVSAALAKSCKLASLLHTSSLFRGAFETAFGQNRSIPAAVVTRWNSTLRQVKAVLNLDMKQLCEVLECQGHENLVFTAREWGQLQELVDLLDPFMDATSLTEGDKIVTITCALPSVLALVKHLKEIKSRLKYCSPVCTALLASVCRRFDGMLQRVQVAKVHRVPDVSNQPFGSDIYIISTFFDPRFQLRWIDNELKLEDEQKEDLRKEVIGTRFM